MSPKHAQIAKDVIGVDRELQAHAVKREMAIEGDELVACEFTASHLHLTYIVYFIRTFKTLTVRLARLTLNGFLENVELIMRTLNEFGSDAEVSMSS